MNMDEEENGPFGGGYGSGCDIHGDDYLRECTMCGIEFCAACNPRTALCPDCAAQADPDDEEEAPAGEEDKELRLLDGFNDDEPPGEGASEPQPRAPAAPKSRSRAKAAGKSRPAAPAKAPAVKSPRPAARSRPAAKANKKR